MMNLDSPTGLTADPIIAVTRGQVEHFGASDAPCRALQLPDGVLLRYTPVASLFFYLRTGIADGKISTRVFASDSPYEREKTAIGEVATPMFEPRADQNHMRKVERLLASWVAFVRDGSGPGRHRRPTTRPGGPDHRGRCLCAQGGSGHGPAPSRPDRGRDRGRLPRQPGEQQ